MQLWYKNICVFYVYGTLGTVGKTAVTTQLTYGLLDKAPKLEDIIFITSLWLALQMSFLPPLHIKLGLMKNFVKAIDQEGDDFKFLKDFFGAHKSDAKLKAGIFVGPEIKKLMQN